MWIIGVCVCEFRSRMLLLVLHNAECLPFSLLLSFPLYAQTKLKIAEKHDRQPSTMWLHARPRRHHHHRRWSLFKPTRENHFFDNAKVEMLHFNTQMQSKNESHSLVRAIRWMLRCCCCFLYFFKFFLRTEKIETFSAQLFPLDYCLPP